MRKIAFLLLFVFTLGFPGRAPCAEPALSVDNVPKISVDELKAMLGSPDLVLIDVRTSHDWDESATKIKGAVREDAHRIGSWMGKYPEEKTLVFYCA